MSGHHGSFSQSTVARLAMLPASGRAFDRTQGERAENTGARAIGAALEADAQRDRLRLECRLPRRIFGGRSSSLPVLRTSPATSPAAWAAWPGEAVVTSGMVLAVEDVLLAALTDRSFFDVTGGDDWQASLPMRVAIPSHPIRLRFGDASGAGEGSGPDASAIAMPLDDWRLCQYELLRELVVNWLYLHEVAHWVDGHLALVRSRSGASGTVGEMLALKDDGRSSAPPLARAGTFVGSGFLSGAQMMKAIELRADHLGFGLLARVEGLASPRRRGAFSRYARRLSSVRDPGGAVALLGLDGAARVRAALVAAGTAVLVIEHLARGNGGSSSYPRPTTRLLNLQLAVLAVSGFVRSDPDGAYLAPSAAEDPSFARYAKEALGWPLVDLRVPARHLGMTDLFGFGDGSAGLDDATLFVSDLLRWFETQEPERFSTEAGRELAAFLEPLFLLENSVAAHRPYAAPGQRRTSGA